jgi:membrane-associated phospholipid phosphatase
MMIFWFLLTSIGNTVITIPITLTIAIWLLASREWRMSLLWCVLFGVAMILVLITKIAFIGWGLGIESLDFTGISGHATRAAMVIPILFYFGLQRAPRKITSMGVYAGVALGAAISVSRVMVNAHSGSEMVAGWLLGSGMCLIFLQFMKNHSVLISRRWLLACSFSLLFISPVMKPFQPDDLIIKLALAISGHEKPFDRLAWGHNSHELHFWYRK